MENNTNCLKCEGAGEVLTLLHGWVECDQCDGMAAQAINVQNKPKYSFMDVDPGKINKFFNSFIDKPFELRYEHIKFEWPDPIIDKIIDNEIKFEKIAINPVDDLLEEIRKFRIEPSKTNWGRYMNLQLTDLLDDSQEPPGAFEESLEVKSSDEGDEAAGASSSEVP